MNRGLRGEPRHSLAARVVGPLPPAALREGRDVNPVQKRRLDSTGPEDVSSLSRRGVGALPQQPPAPRSTVTGRTGTVTSGEATDLLKREGTEPPQQPHPHLKRTPLFLRSELTFVLDSLPEGLGVCYVL
jgi:hypothetical protein